MDAQHKDNHTDLAEILARIEEPTSEEAGKVDGLTVVDQEGRTIRLSAEQVRQIFVIIAKRLIAPRKKRIVLRLKGEDGRP
jgi:hypothetical protein